MNENINILLDEYMELQRKRTQNNTSSQLYYQELLLKKVFSRFKFDLPEEWDRDYFLTVLFIGGYLAITDTALGVLPLRCSYTGINVFNRPTNIIIANPVLGNLRRIIDKDAVLLKLQYDYIGVMPIINRYAALLAECDSSIAVNLRNSKVTLIARASSKAQAKTLEAMYKKIDKGQPIVIVSEDAVNPEEFSYMPVKNSYVADSIQELKRSIISEFLTEIGVNNNAQSSKKERLIVDEVNSNDTETQLNVTHWLENIDEGFDKANNMFNLNLSVELRDFAPAANTNAELNLEGGKANGSDTI